MIQIFPKQNANAGRRRFGPGAAVIPGRGGSQAAGSGGESEATAALTLTVSEAHASGNYVDFDLTGSEYDDYEDILEIAQIAGAPWVTKTADAGTGEFIIPGAIQLTASRTFRVELSGTPTTPGSHTVYLKFGEATNVSGPEM